MKQCPKCNSDDIKKSGIVKNRQRYKCKSCNYHFTVEQIGKPDNKKRDALICFLLGLNYRTTGKLLNINHSTAYSWIKLYSTEIKKLKGEKVKISDFDDLSGYITGIKGKTEHGLILIDLVEGTIKIVLTEK
jgi:transposase